LLDYNWFWIQMKWMDRYEKQEEIGIGASGKIYKVIRKDTK